MKYITVVISLLFAFTALAQPPHPDTVAWAGIRAQLINAPIIQEGAVAMTLVPVNQRYCFDMTLDVDMKYGSQLVQQALFLNTTDGYIGFTPATTGGIGTYNMIVPEIPDFSFTVFGYQGNAYHYFNRKNKQGVQEHWVSTGNTDMHKYQLTNGLTAAPIIRKNVRKSFCGGAANAMAYKLGDGPTVWYVYGDHYPEKLHVRKFFGGFGVGVIRTDEGVYMLMEMEAGATRFTITHIDQALACFNPAGYKIEEDEFIIKRRRDLDVERDRIERHALEAQRATTCQPQRLAIVAFEREQLRLQEEALNNMGHGNIYQDSVTQQGYTAMMDPLTTVQSGILQGNLSICQAGETLSHGPSESARQKLACNTTLVAKLTDLEQQMRRLDRQYAGQPGMALAKKSQLLLAEMRNGCQ